MKTPRQIVECLDQLEAYHDVPNTVLRLVGELRWHLERWAAEQAAIGREVEQYAETIREQTAEIQDLWAKIERSVSV